MCQPPIILDIEASGFGAGSYPIEVGFVLSSGRSFCTLIIPAPSWSHWDAAAESIHGLPRQTLFDHGRPVQDVAEMLNSRLRGEVVYSDAWGADYAWLATLYEAAGRTPSFRLDHLARIVPEASAVQWNAIRARIETELGLRRHRASADAKVLQQTWIALSGPPETAIRIPQGT